MADAGATTASYVPALIAFSGVVTGSLISVGFQWWKEHVDRKRREQERRVELRTAARLVMQENAPYYVNIVQVIANPDLPLPTERRMEAWEKYSSILAAHLQDQEWFFIIQSLYIWIARDSSQYSFLSKLIMQWQSGCIWILFWQLSRLIQSP